MAQTGYLVYSTQRSGWNYKVNVAGSQCFLDKSEAEAYLAEMKEKSKDNSHVFWFMSDVNIQGAKEN